MNARQRNRAADIEAKGVIGGQLPQQIDSSLAPDAPDAPDTLDALDARSNCLVIPRML